MLEFLDSFDTTLDGYLKASDDHIILPLSVVKRLNKMGEGNYVYLTLEHSGRYEILKFTRTDEVKGCKVPVDRDVDNLGRKNFPLGTCVRVKWNSRQLQEFIAQVKV